MLCRPLADESAEHPVSGKGRVHNAPATCVFQVDDGAAEALTQLGQAGKTKKKHRKAIKEVEVALFSAILDRQEATECELHSGTCRYVNGISSLEIGKTVANAGWRAEVRPFLTPTWNV